MSADDDLAHGFFEITQSRFRVADVLSHEHKITSAIGRYFWKELSLISDASIAWANVTFSVKLLFCDPFFNFNISTTTPLDQQSLYLC